MDTLEETYLDDSIDTAGSGISWAAVFAGAAAAAALSLILLVLGVGLGFSTISPWPDEGINATTLGVSTIVWLIVTQIVASGIGGYLAGRLRVKWTAMHTDEVFFRDTAHGFLTWAVASLVVALLVGTVMGKAISGAASAGSAIAGTALSMAGAAGVAAGVDASNDAGSKKLSSADSMMNYMIDSLFRPVEMTEAAPPPDAATVAEAGRIFANNIHSSALPPQDAQYLAQIVAHRTSLSVPEAEKRVNETFNRLHNAINKMEQNARETADKARKAAAHSALWMFIALLAGAFIASLAATFGGKQRDHVTYIKRADS